MEKNNRLFRIIVYNLIFVIEYLIIFYHRYNLKEFKENMTMVLNPQIYDNDKYGLLIEDTVKITQTNFVLLTKVDRDIDYITVY